MALSRTHHGVRKVVSGGQTGVDRAALDVALQLGIEHGGWCPKGRLAEDGRIAERYALREMPSVDYAARTEQNVIDSDGTLILYCDRLQGGTLLTHRLAKSYNKPLHRVRLDLTIQYAAVIRWLQENQIQVLNVAGPRASTQPDIQRRAVEMLTRLFASTQRLPLDASP